VLDHVDRVLYVANGHVKVGTPDEVLRSEVLSDLYGSPVEVLRTGGRIIVAGAVEDPHHHDEPDADAGAPHVHDPATADRTTRHAAERPEHGSAT
jgi:zinc/manganese transport system ATP-binding protein